MGLAREDLGFLWAIGRRHRTLVLVIVVLSVLASGFDGISIGMLVPLLGDLQQREDDRGVARALRAGWGRMGSVRQEWRVHALLGLVVAAVALKNLLTFLSIRSGHRLSSRLVADVRSAAVRRLLRAGVEFHDRSKPGDLHRSGRPPYRASRGADQEGVEFVANALTLAALTGVLFALSWRLAVLAARPGNRIRALRAGLHAPHDPRWGRTTRPQGRRWPCALHEVAGGDPADQVLQHRERRHVAELDQSIEAVCEASFRRTIYGFAIHPITDVAATIALAALFVASLVAQRRETRG